jgi:hypothetical protein
MTTIFQDHPTLVAEVKRVFLASRSRSGFISCQTDFAPFLVKQYPHIQAGDRMHIYHSMCDDHAPFEVTMPRFIRKREFLQVDESHWSGWIFQSHHRNPSSGSFHYLFEDEDDVLMFKMLFT